MIIGFALPEDPRNNDDQNCPSERSKNDGQNCASKRLKNDKQICGGGNRPKKIHRFRTAEVGVQERTMSLLFPL
jgi:hypothetical protein